MMANNKAHARLLKLTTLALLAAMAYVVMFFLRIPMISFLKYDPKDIIITIGGFLYGPLAAFAVSVVVSVLEMFTVSDTGPIGLVMNILATCAFSCLAAYIYKRHKTLKSAVVGLCAGVLSMTAVMLLWNYIITPFYLNTSRAEVAAMLVPVFLPFNLIKGGLNAAITILLYKPLVLALRRARLAPPSLAREGAKKGEKRGFQPNLGVSLVALAVVVTLVLLILALGGRLGA